MSVTGLIERDNDARRRLGMREIDGTVGVDLLSGMHIRMYVCMYVCIPQLSDMMRARGYLCVHVCK
jgi:hypothetical protein